MSELQKCAGAGCSKLLPWKQMRYLAKQYFCSAACANTRGYQCKPVAVEE